MSSMIRITVREKFPMCAFCKNWYDVTNMYIEPKAPNVNQWAYDNKASCKCLKKNKMTTGGAGCGCRDFVCKIPLN